MTKRGHRVAFAVAIVTVLLLGLTGSAIAQQSWPDLTQDILDDYDITNAQVAEISDGYLDGLWRPYEPMPRRHFVKMAVESFGLPLLNPAPTEATFNDVPIPADVNSVEYDFWLYIETAAEAGLVEGTSFNEATGVRIFSPDLTVQREQGAAIIARWIASQEGRNLNEEYTEAEIEALLSPFNDDDEVAVVLREEMAFVVDRGIVLGTLEGDLNPKQALLRIQGAAMLIRADILASQFAQCLLEFQVAGSNNWIAVEDNLEFSLLAGTEVEFRLTLHDTLGRPLAADFDTESLNPYLFIELVDVGFRALSPDEFTLDADGRLHFTGVDSRLGDVEVGDVVQIYSVFDLDGNEEIGEGDIFCPIGVDGELGRTTFNVVDFDAASIQVSHGDELLTDGDEVTNPARTTAEFEARFAEGVLGNVTDYYFVWDVDGPNEINAAGPDAQNFGETTFGLVDLNATVGNDTDTITLTVYTAAQVDASDPANPIITGTPVFAETYTKVWTDAPEPPIATIAPLESTNVVGETHTVDVTLADGLVAGDYYFVWDVEGVTTGFGTFPGIDLEGAGEVQFSYVGDVAGDDLIHLWIYEGASADPANEVFHVIVDKTWQEELSGSLTFGAPGVIDLDLLLGDILVGATDVEVTRDDVVIGTVVDGMLTLNAGITLAAGDVIFVDVDGVTYFYIVAEADLAAWFLVNCEYSLDGSVTWQDDDPVDVVAGTAIHFRVQVVDVFGSAVADGVDLSALGLDPLKLHAATDPSTGIVGIHDLPDSYVTAGGGYIYWADATLDLSGVVAGQSREAILFLDVNDNDRRDEGEWFCPTDPFTFNFVAAM